MIRFDRQSFEVLHGTDFTRGISVRERAGAYRQLAHDGHNLCACLCRSHVWTTCSLLVINVPSGTEVRRTLPPVLTLISGRWPDFPVVWARSLFVAPLRGKLLFRRIFREYWASCSAAVTQLRVFVEGGRSRAGRLLLDENRHPVDIREAMLRGGAVELRWCPVYIGYEHVVGGHLCERAARRDKERESAADALKGLRQLRNLGRGYVNFGEPMPLTDITYEPARAGVAPSTL